MNSDTKKAAGVPLVPPELDAITASFYVQIDDFLYEHRGCINFHGPVLDIQEFVRGLKKIGEQADREIEKLKKENNQLKRELSLVMGTFYKEET